MDLCLGITLALTVLIYAVEISAYASRLAGIRTRRPAQARSFYNLLALSARAANALQRTLLAGLVDRAVTAGTVTDLTDTLRLVLGAAAVGIGVGAALIPTLARLLVPAGGCGTPSASAPQEKSVKLMKSDVVSDRL